MRKLYRSQTNKMIVGICGGIGEINNTDPTIVRLVVVLIALATAVLPLLITYLVGWVIIPEGRPSDSPPPTGAPQ
jgi:phage shock protein C